MYVCNNFCTSLSHCIICPDSSILEFSQLCCLSMSLSASPVPNYFTIALIFHCTNRTQTTIIQYKNSAVTEKYSDAHSCLCPTMKSSSSSWNAIEYLLLDSVFSSLWCQEKSYSSIKGVLTRKWIFLMCHSCVYMIPIYIYINIYNLN